MYIVDRKLSLNDFTDIGSLVELFQGCIDEMIELKVGCQGVYIDIWAKSEISPSIIEFIEAHFNQNQALRRIFTSVGYQITIVPIDGEKTFTVTI